MASLNTNHVFFILLVLSSSLLFFPSLAKAHESVSFYNSIYSFGDSNSSSISSSYSINDIGDHLAAVLELPAPQSHTQEGAEFESGLSFMTPGATVMAPFFFIKNGILPPPQSHHSQINIFMNLFYKDCFNFHDCGRNKVLQRAIIFMDQPGFNDYKEALLQGKSTMEVSKLVPDVVEMIRNNIERLINEARAKHFLVSGILPMGCLSGFRTLVPESRNNKCHKGLNMFSKLHNDHLWQALHELRLKYPEVEIVYADYYKGFMSILRNHAFHGFRTKTLMKSCGEEGVEACSNTASHVLWDGFRLTPKASKNLIDTLFSKKGFVFPEFKFAEDQAAAQRHHSKIYALFRDGLRNLLFRHGAAG